jgi:hypothetical protein
VKNGKYGGWKDNFFIRKADFSAEKSALWAKEPTFQQNFSTSIPYIRILTLYKYTPFFLSLRRDEISGPRAEL